MGELLQPYQALLISLLQIQERLLLPLTWGMFSQVEPLIHSPLTYRRRARIQPEPIRTTLPPPSAPVNTVPSAQTVSEDTALSFTAQNGTALISVADVDSDLASVVLSVNNGTLSVTAGSATVTNNNSSSVTISGTQTAINSALATLAYQANANWNGTDTLTILSTDGGGRTDSDTVSITVNAVNDAPTNTAPSSVNANQNTSFTFSGTEKILVADVDNSNLTVELTVANGILSATQNGGLATITGSSTKTLTIAGSTGDINKALETLSYKGDLTFSGSDTLTIKTSDGSSGQGGTTTSTVTINVAAQATGPVNTVPGAQTVAEDTVLAFTNQKTISVADADGDLASVVLSVNHGTLSVTVGSATVTNNSSSSVTISGTQAAINASLATLTYQASSNYNGSDTLTILSTDGGARTDSDTVSITVSPVNDKPTNSAPAAVNAREDVDFAFTDGSLISVADPDTADTITVVLAVTKGTLKATQNSGSAGITGFNTATLTLTGSVAAINLALQTLVYKGNTNYVGSDTLTITSSDGSGGQGTKTDVSITVESTNVAPVISIEAGDNATPESSESNTGIATSGKLTVRDADTEDNVSVVVTAFAAEGTTYTGQFGTKTLQDAAKSWFSLSPSANIAAESADVNNLAWNFNSGTEAFNYLAVGESLQLTYTIEATDGRLSDTQNVIVKVNGVNDAPTLAMGTGDGDAFTRTEINANQTASAATAKSLTVRDPDLSDTVKATIKGSVAVTAAGGAPVPAGTPDQDALLSYLWLYQGPAADGIKRYSGDYVENISANPDLPDGGQDDGDKQNITWNFQAATKANGYSAFDYLADGENIILTYTIEVEDGGGEKAAKTVSISINGVNTAPGLKLQLDSTNLGSFDYSDPIDQLVIEATDVDGRSKDGAMAVSYAWDYQAIGGSFSDTWTPGLPDAGSLGNLNNPIGLGSLDTLAGGATSTDAKWTLSGIADLEPGNYRIQISVSDGSGTTTASSSKVVEFTVEPEDATPIEYSGALFVTTSTSDTSTAVVPLQALLTDNADGYRGNITKANATFYDVSANTIISNSGGGSAADMPVSGITSANINGSSSFNWTITGINTDTVTKTVQVRAGSFYTGASGTSNDINSLDYSVITIAKPGGQFMTGGGTIGKRDGLTGYYMGTYGKNAEGWINYGFTTKYNKTNKNLLGNATIIIRGDFDGDGIINYWQIKSNATNSLSRAGTSNERATLLSKANITDLETGLSVAGNFDLRVDVIDADRTTATTDVDRFGFNLYSGTQLMFATSSTKDLMNNLSGGQVVIH